MNKLLYFYIAVSLSFLISCNGTSDLPGQFKDPARQTQVYLVDSVVNFGEVTDGEHIDIRFRIKNVGKLPLVIYNVVPTCGCTVTNFPKTPILPGCEGLITATFNSSGMGGETVMKGLEMIANLKGGVSRYLYFRGNILEKS